LLHQFQRDRDDAGNIYADLADYELAARLLREPLRQLLGLGLAAPVLRFYQRLTKWFTPGHEFSSQDARGKERNSRRAVSGWLSELHQAGILELEREHQGRRPAVWKLTAAGLRVAKDEVLPDAGDVFG